MPVMGDTHSIVCKRVLEVEGGGLLCHMFFFLEMAMLHFSVTITLLWGLPFSTYAHLSPDKFKRVTIDSTPLTHTFNGYL